MGEVYRARYEPVGAEGGGGTGQERVEESLTIQPQNGKKRIQINEEEEEEEQRYSRGSFYVGFCVFCLWPASLIH